MNIEKLTGFNPLAAFNKINSDKKANSKANNVDKLDISPEAMKIASSKTKNLDEINEKLESGFYNSDEVIEKLATALLKEFNSIP